MGAYKSLRALQLICFAFITKSGDEQNLVNHQKRSVLVINSSVYTANTAWKHQKTNPPKQNLLSIPRVLFLHPFSTSSEGGVKKRGEEARFKKRKAADDLP